MDLFSLGGSTTDVESCGVKTFMLHCLWALLLLNTVPEPIAQWEISFVPAFALVRDNGSSLIFDQNGLVAYEYDIHGQLLTSFTLEKPVRDTFNAADGTPVVGFEDDLLAGLNPSGNLRWQRELKPTTVPLTNFGQFVLYTVDENILLLDPRDGSTHFSLHHSQELMSTFGFDGQVWFSDSKGDASTWEPFTEKKQGRFKDREFAIRGALRFPNGWYLLSSDDGLIEVFREQGKRRWRRHFQIDLATPPLLLQGKDELQLLVATKGRNLFVFGALNGIQRSRLLLTARPRALVGFGRETALLVGVHSSELLWYDAAKATFEIQKLQGMIDEVANSESFLLLIAEDGTIRLFKK